MLAFPWQEGEGLWDQDGGDAQHKASPLRIHTAPAFTGRYFAMSLRKPLRTRRGGGRVVRGRDACVALAGGEIRSRNQDEGDASVPTLLHTTPAPTVSPFLSH